MIEVISGLELLYDWNFNKVTYLLAYFMNNIELIVEANDLSSE